MGLLLVTWQTKEDFEQRNTISHIYLREWQHLGIDSSRAIVEAGRTIRRLYSVPCKS